ncbi:hypothetical protein HZS_2751 [Henneguya salminicola]|nr:hypothetical protein HZS_2751 [Henneguya salminicola]
MGDCEALLERDQQLIIPVRIYLPIPAMPLMCIFIACNNITDLMFLVFTRNSLEKSNAYIALMPKEITMDFEIALIIEIQYESIDNR